VFSRIDHIGVAVEQIEPALELYRDSLQLLPAHREVVEEQGVEAVLLDVGENHVELLAPLGAVVAAALAVGGLWFVRDIALYGSPFWPHLSVPWGESKPRFFELVGERFIARPAATTAAA